MFYFHRYTIMYLHERLMYVNILLLTYTHNYRIYVENGKIYAFGVTRGQTHNIRTIPKTPDIFTDVSTISTTYLTVPIYLTNLKKYTNCVYFIYTHTHIHFSTLYLSFFNNNNNNNASFPMSIFPFFLRINEAV